MRKHGLNRGPKASPHPSRRDFLKLSAMAAAAGASGAAGRLITPAARASQPSRGNSLPGRIVMIQDPLMNGHGTIDVDQVELHVHEGVRMLTRAPGTGAAFESLFEGITPSSTFAIKVNCIGPCDTRWEVVRGIVTGLAQMFGNTYDISQVTIFDRHNLPGHGYTADRFTIGENTANISSTSSPSSEYIYGGYRISSHNLNADYIINVPALKSHDVAANGITIALKNHYGSCYPSSLCGNTDGMLTINAHDYIKPKTGLVVLSGLRGTYNGGPGISPQLWSLFDEQTPNMLYFSTDPVTNEYWARDLINAERIERGYGAKTCGWIEEASGDPYYIGVSDPEAMMVVTTSAVEDDEAIRGATAFLAANTPNPFAESTTLRFRLLTAGAARLTVVDPSGRTVRDLADRSFPAGYSQVRWDGCDHGGRRLPNGVYFARLKTQGGSHTRRILMAR